MSDLPYVPSVLAYQRRRTRVVAVGKVLVGGSEPIRVQSMTTTPTWDVSATIEQSAQLVDAGCEIVRLTVPSKKDAQALPGIREGLLKRGLDVPLVADIHFAPSLAMFCVDHVDKVRINPGNFVDSKFFKIIEYSDTEYNDELKRLEDAFTPLVLKAKKQGISMRIGTNHGSLSDRILNRYGDTPLGMVESALEFVRICLRHSYHDLIMSMKSSNPIVMIQAYRLLAAHMTAEGMDAPFHLGVTEAGDGLDARVKSAVGIGSLLIDGIGDTIRVSLTENPCAEVPVGFQLVKLVEKLKTVAAPKREEPAWINPYEFNRRVSRLTDFGGLAYGRTAVPRVEVDIKRSYLDGDYQLPTSPVGDGIEMLCASLERSSDLSMLPELTRCAEEKSSILSLGLSADLWMLGINKEVLQSAGRIELGDLSAENCAHESYDHWLKAAQDYGLGLSLRVKDLAAVAALRRAARRDIALAAVIPLEGIRKEGLERARTVLSELRDVDVPVVLSWECTDHDMVLAPSAVIGGLLCDGLGDALRVPVRGSFDGVDPVNVAYTLLQATRYRTVRTEYVSCPSCGRTLFDLEETSAKIKALTGHLPNVTIAIMGCIVNGPGEMADADFGYVGWKPGKVDLWVGKDLVEKAIAEQDAPERLVELLKRHGAWVEPVARVSAGDHSGQGS
jgi:(E)-4-hydroxy-3-methylbut-2-enyl-diphosphate synthase